MAQDGKKINLSLFTIKQLLELEGCTRCGECIVACPTYAETQNEAITPLDKIATLQGFIKGEYGGFLARLFGNRPPTDETLKRFTGGVYDCTLCARCNVVCPVHINTRSLWIAMREQMVELDEYPAAFDHLLETVGEHYNISGDPNENRLGWTANMDAVPEGLDRKEGAEIVYFMGCVAPFYPMVYSVPQSFVSILDTAGVSYTTMGGEEYCCGFPLIIAGMGKHAHDMIRHNVEAVRALGAKKLVAACPSCYHTWKHDYAKILGEPLGFEVLHEVELLAEMVRDGAFDLKPVSKAVTYHDPCDLGRTSGIYDEPRQIIEAIPGLTFVEMEDNCENSLCCGGGGDVEMANAETSHAVARSRMLQAQETGAKFIITACQQCKRTLLGAARREKIRVRTLDISELLWESVQ
jgi:heterodisulfide reductase subunit D